MTVFAHRIYIRSGAFVILPSHHDLHLLVSHEIIEAVDAAGIWRCLCSMFWIELPGHQRRSYLAMVEFPGHDQRVVARHRIVAAACRRISMGADQNFIRAIVVEVAAEDLIDANIGIAYTVCHQQTLDGRPVNRLVYAFDSGQTRHSVPRPVDADDRPGGHFHGNRHLAGARFIRRYRFAAAYRPNGRVHSICMVDFSALEQSRGFLLRNPFPTPGSAKQFAVAIDTGIQCILSSAIYMYGR